MVYDIKETKNKTETVTQRIGNMAQEIANEIVELYKDLDGEPDPNDITRDVESYFAETERLICGLVEEKLKK